MVTLSHKKQDLGTIWGNWEMGLGNYFRTVFIDFAKYIFVLNSFTFCQLGLELAPLFYCCLYNLDKNHIFFISIEKIFAPRIPEGQWLVFANAAR